MLFNSLEFLYFFLVVTTVYFLLPHRYRWILLLASSCYFYMAFVPVYILILLGTIIIDYIAGICIEQKVIHDQQKQAKLFLIISLVANIGVLAVFKYYNFFIDNTHFLFQSLKIGVQLPYLHILLPIGLSFHTFQAMSYTIEVYRGHQKAERHFGIYALYVMFYPQLVAGPIERPQQMLHQFYEKKYFNTANAVTGLNLIAFGLFKKIVVADRLGIYVNQVYGDIENASTLSTLMAVCFFSIQIYCDFSGYTDIARGAAKFMGYDLMVNFNKPYSAQSIAEFWNRWHISLSTWFKDYVYIPLGGNRVGKAKWLRNLLIVFLLSGIWHGANWTFVIWGGLHAFYLIMEILTKETRHRIISLPNNIAKYINPIIVFVLVTFAWIFFRSETLSKATQVISKLIEFDFSLNPVQLCAEKGPLNLLLTLLSIGLLLVVSPPKFVADFKRSVLFLIAITFLIILLGKNGSTDFIYFQF